MSASLAADDIIENWWQATLG